MTQLQANQRVNEILNGLNRLGLLPSGTPFVLKNGQLVAEPHPELNSHWRPLWKPNDETMLPLDLERFPVEVAAGQIARYRHATYIVVRKKLENLFAAFAGDGELPIEMPLLEDSFLIASVGLSIEEQSQRGQEPKYQIMLETHPIAERVEPGEPTPESEYVDVTDLTAQEISKIAHAS